VEAKMRPSTIAAIWVAGAVLAVLAYVVGPDRLVSVAWNALINLQDNVLGFVAGLANVGFDLLRAMAIGLFIVFVVLSVIAIRRTRRGVTGLLVVSVVFMFAVESGPAGPSRSGWLMGFLLALVGAISMTGRLLRADSGRR
jgi:hypothetical protein